MTKKRNMTKLDKVKINYFLSLKGLKQLDVAAEIGMTVGATNRALNGAPIRPATAYAISKAIGIDLDKILDNGKSMTF